MTIHRFPRIGLSATLLGMLCSACSGGSTGGTGGTAATSTGSDTTTSSVGGAGGGGATTTATTGGMTSGTGGSAAPVCGDGHTDAGEECDDGAMNSDTGACTKDCKKAACGDGFKQMGEDCDEGAKNSDTGTCTTKCKVPACGDGFLQAGEQCDLGAMNSDTGACTSMCKNAACGDGLVAPTEGCDLGAANSDTGACTTMCKSATCGDALVQSTVEQCDLGMGNNLDTGACTSMCKNASCGDGFVRTGVEECDTGAANADTAACTSMCKAAKCGDGLVQTGTEECDLGAANANAGTCTLACKNAKCGDGFKQGTEACDDGNAVNGDGCNSDCVISGTPLSTVTYTSPGGNSNWNGVVIDSTGNIIVAGAESTAANGFDAVVIKYNATGTVIWKQTFNDATNNLDDAAYAVAVDPSGNVIVTGVSKDATSGNDIWVRKYNSAGATQWTQFFDGGLNLDDAGNSVAADSKGDIFITGTVQNVAGQGTNIITAKLAGINGTIVWSDTVNNINNVAGGNDGGLGIALKTVANVTSVVVTGYTAASSTQLDGWTRKYTDGATATTIWTQTYTGTSAGNDFGQTITFDATGNVIAAGGELVTGQGFNAWVRKYTAAGATTWTTKYNKMGANLDDAATGIITDASGNVIVTGYETPVNTHTDIWTEKLDPAGNVLWKQTFNGPVDSDDAGVSAAVDATGNVYIAGYIAASATNSTAWLTKYAP